MLACARIGAIHSVVFGGFSPESLRDRMNDAEAKVVITADGGYRRGQIVPLKRNADKALEGCPTVSTWWWCSARRGPDGRGARGHAGGARPLVAPPHAARADHCPPSPWTPRTCSSSSTRPARPASRRASCTPPAATSPAAAPPGTCSTSRRRRVLVHRRRGLDHRALVPGVWPARQRGHVRDVRGRARLARADRFWEHLRAPRRDHLLHGAHRHPRLHEVGGEHPRAHDLTQLRLLGSWGSRSIPRRGCGITSTSAARAAPSWTRGGRRRPGHRHLAAARPDGHHTRQRHHAASRLLGGPARRPRPGGSRPAAGSWPSPGRGRPCCAPSGATTSGTWTPTSPSGPAAPTSTSRRRRQARRRRLLLDPRPRGRRAQRGRPPHRHHGGESALVEHPAVAEAAVVGKAHELKGQAIVPSSRCATGFT
jgi:hypothetical protein